jgi:hypothetical protein
METPFYILRRLWRRWHAADVDSPSHGVGPRLLVVVEGRHDIEFLRRISAILHTDRVALPDLAALERRNELMFLPAGGDDFRPWTTRLAGLACAQFHLYDRELPPVSLRREQCAAIVNLRPHCRAFVTARRSLENYLHPLAIQEARGCQLTFSEGEDVALLAAQAMFARHDGAPAWEALSRRARRRLRDRAKIWLNREAVERMTPERLAECDPSHEVIGWLLAIRGLLDLLA